MSSSNPILNFLLTMLNNFLDFLPTLLLAIIVFAIGEKFIMTPLFDLIIAFNKGNYNKL